MCKTKLTLVYDDDLGTVIEKVNKVLRERGLEFVVEDKETEELPGLCNNQQSLKEFTKIVEEKSKQYLNNKDGYCDYILESCNK